MCTVIHGCSHLGGPDMRVLASKQKDPECYSSPLLCRPHTHIPKGPMVPCPPRDQAQAERADAGRTVVAGWFPVPA